MGSPTAPAYERAAVELITEAINAGHTDLALAVFEAHTPEERDRIAAIVRTRILRAVRIARSRRV